MYLFYISAGDRINELDYQKYLIHVSKEEDCGLRKKKKKEAKNFVFVFCSSVLGKIEKKSDVTETFPLIIVKFDCQWNKHTVSPRLVNITRRL